MLRYSFHSSSKGESLIYYHFSYRNNSISLDLPQNLFFSSSNYYLSPLRRGNKYYRGLSRHNAQLYNLMWQWSTYFFLIKPYIVFPSLFIIWKYNLPFYYPLPVYAFKVSLCIYFTDSFTVISKLFTSHSSLSLGYLQTKLAQCIYCKALYILLTFPLWGYWRVTSTLCFPSSKPVI